MSRLLACALLALSAWGCRPSASDQKNRCQRAADCLSGYLCEEGICKRNGAVSIRPRTIALPAGGQQVFTASVTGSPDAPVAWSVEEASGCGSITEGGAYTAPEAAATCHVAATNIADASRSDAATVTVTPPEVNVTVDPPALTLLRGERYKLWAAVAGTADRAVTWSVREPDGCGTISPAGVYTAPDAEATCHVVASSHANPAGEAEVSVRVTPIPMGACASEPLRTTGTVYYFCECGTGADPECVPGDDSASGTRPSSPRRSLAHAASLFNEMDAGDTIALCRGGAWDIAVGIGAEPANPRCTAGNTCDFRDYAPPWASAPGNRPRINNGTEHVFAIWNDKAAYEGLRFWNLDLRPTGGEASGFCFSQSYQHIDLCNLTIRGGFVGVNVQVAATGGHITLRNSLLEGNRSAAFYGGGPHLTVDSNAFVNNGGQNQPPELSNRLHTIALGCDPESACKGMRITNNHLRTDPDGPWGRCRGAMLFLGWSLPATDGPDPSPVGVVVENNLIIGDAPAECGGIEISGRYSPPESPTEVHRAAFRRNRIYWGEGEHVVAMGVSACTGCTVSDNVIEVAGPFARAIVSPLITHAARPGYSATTGTVVQNNTVRLTGGGDSVGISVGMEPEGQDFVVEDNAVWMSQGETCVSVSRPLAAGHPFDDSAGNYCSNGPGPAELMWVNPAHRDYTPADPGPLMGTANQTSFSPKAIGAVTWDPSDAGVDRVAPIDIGAFQR